MEDSKICLFFQTALVFFLFFSASFAFAEEAFLSWSPDDPSNPIGYKVYYGTRSRSYTKSIDVGKRTEYTLKGLEPATYYFAVTVYNSLGESDFSTEVSKTFSAPKPPPEAPPAEKPPAPAPPPTPSEPPPVTKPPDTSSSGGAPTDSASNPLPTDSHAPPPETVPPVNSPGAPAVAPQTPPAVTPAPFPSQEVSAASGPKGTGGCSMILPEGGGAMGPGESGEIWIGAGIILFVKARRILSRLCKV